MARHATLSKAMTWKNGQGLFHPNCRHSVSVWLPGISGKPKKKSKAEIEEQQKLYKATQQLNYINRQIQKWKNRVSVAFLEEDKIKSKAKLKEWRDRKKQHLEEYPELR